MQVRLEDVRKLHLANIDRLREDYSHNEIFYLELLHNIKKYLIMSLERPIDCGLCIIRIVNGSEEITSPVEFILYLFKNNDEIFIADVVDIYDKTEIVDSFLDFRHILSDDNKSENFDKLMNFSTSSDASMKLTEEAEIRVKHKDFLIACFKKYHIDYDKGE